MSKDQKKTEIPFKPSTAKAKGPLQKGDEKRREASKLQGNSFEKTPRFGM